MLKYIDCNGLARYWAYCDENVWRVNFHIHHCLHSEQHMKLHELENDYEHIVPIEIDIIDAITGVNEDAAGTGEEIP